MVTASKNGKSKITVTPKFSKVVEFITEKETKGTYRFAEEGKAPIVGTLYVKKLAFGENEPPKRLRVTIEEV